MKYFGNRAVQKFRQRRFLLKVNSIEQLKIVYCKRFRFAIDDILKILSIGKRPRVIKFRVEIKE